VLARHLRERPDAPLVVAPETGLTFTYGDLAREAHALGARLAALGLRSGDHVGMLLHNGWQTVVIFLGAMTGGYVVAPFNLLSQRSQLAYVLGHSDCRVVFTSAEHVRQLDEALADVPAARRAAIAVEVIDVDSPHAYPACSGAAEGALAGGREGADARGGEGADARGGDGSNEEARERAGEVADVAPPIDGEAPALLMYTSGTTGVPKGALLSHANLLHAAHAVADWHGLGSADRVLSSLPLYHINGQCIATVTPFVSGGSIVAPHRFSVSHWWEWVEAHRPTWLNMVPTIIAYLLNAADAGRRHAFPSVRFGRSASAPLPPDQHRAFEQTFAIPVIEAMGMTECASVVFCNPQDPARRRYGTPGLPCGVEAKVIDTQSKADLPDGATGELMLRGRNVMRGYYHAPEKTREALEPDGWLHTGDLGYRDADGFYFVTGRIKELIIKGGENIAPREIDEALLRHPAVLEAASVGIPDRDYGQDILACVVLKPGHAPDETALRAFCLAELGRYKTPRAFRFVAELPKGPSGKVQRLKLLDGA
jgi:long-chain acyl-CoA synthetase